MTDPFIVLSALADGGIHCASALGLRHGLGPAAVAGAVRELRARGIDVESLGGREYRLDQPLELLDAASIRGGSSPSARARLAGIEILPEVDSTNDYLLRRASQGAPTGSVCLAESQTAGKGRQGRRWASPLAANVYLSMLYRVPAAAELGALGLVTGLAVVRALEMLGVETLGLKWPNDVLWRERKLAGVLLEAGGRGGGAFVVIGIGVNVAMPAGVGETLERPWTDLASILGAPPSRNNLAAALVNALIDALVHFERCGLAGLAQAWRRYDAIQGHMVTLDTGAGPELGRAAGIDARGHLLLDTQDGRRAYPAGEVSLRGYP